MTRTRKWALALCWVLLCSSYSNAQVDPITGNLITNPGFTNGSAGWTTTGNGTAGMFGAGGSDAYQFSWQAGTVSQSIAVNQALTGTGIMVNGLQYGWRYANWCKNQIGGEQSCFDSEGIVDQLSANVSLTNSAGANVYSQSFNYNTWLYAWQQENQNVNFATPYSLNGLNNLTISFSGVDSGGWTGLYGPVVTDVYAKLKYSVDPCAQNPAYSSTCAGFNKILNTNNLLDSTQGGLSLNQAFAVNTALSNAGVGAMVHGFNYGFNWRVGQGFSGCTATNQDGSCSWYMNMPAYANATVSLTNSSNQTIHSKSYSFTGDSTSGSVSDKYLLPSSMNQSMLGMGRITGSASGTNSSVEGAWATMIYTADPCVANPLHSSNCKGYAFAMSKQLSASNKMTGADAAPSIEPTPGAQSDPTQPPPPPGGPTLAGGPPPGSEPPPGSQPPPGAPPPPGATQTASSNSSNSSNSSANQPPPQGGGGSQPRAGEVKTAGDNKSSSASPVSLSSVLSMISSNQARIGNEAKAVVQAAESQATQAAAAAQQQAETVAGAAAAQSVSGSSTGTSASPGTTARTTTQTETSAFSLPTGQTATASSVEAIRPPAQVDTAETTQNAGTGLSVTAPTSQYSLFTAPAAGTVSSDESPIANFGFQLPTGRASTQSEPESTPQPDAVKIGSQSALNDAVEQRPMLPTTTAPEQKTTAVNKNAQSNTIAGRVDIAAMATQPQGYQAYSAIMPDVAFYAPREIYRNQRTVDNARALRQLSSDRLHQDLVNLQYK
jgi:hypothetical protein